MPASGRSGTVLERILSERGFSPGEELEEFLAPDYDRHLFSPFLFRQMETAVRRILTAIHDGEQICIVGDYDADGVTASALLKEMFRFAGHRNLHVEIPHRVEDGYGITPELIGRIAGQAAPSLVITVDNGITALDAAKAAAAAGMDLIITDHHQPREELPRALAVLNPWVPGETYPFKPLSGVGVAYKLACALVRRLPGCTGGEAFLKWLLDLTAMGTVADIVSLTGENRVLVFYGLKVIAKSRRPGVRALLEYASAGRIDAETIAFQLGPRLNAAGRLEHADLAYRLLTCESESEARSLAEELEQLNRRRQRMVSEAVKRAREEADRQIDAGERILLLSGDSLHPGVVGLIAGKLADEKNMPAVVMSCYGHPEYYTASCRTVGGFSISEMLDALQHFFLRSGGHPAAGGFSLPVEQRPVFEEALFSYAREQLDGVVLEEELQIDAVVSVEELTLENYAAIHALFPFGEGNREPVLAVCGVRLSECRAVGSEFTHLRIGFGTAAGTLFGIGFRLGHLASVLQPGDTVDFAAYLRDNEYNGKVSAQVVLLDIRKSQ